MTRPRAALLNAHFSANLGDGLLSDSLMFGLKEHLDSFPVDLAARETISTLGGSRRGQIIKGLNALPSPIRSFLISRIQAHLLKTKWQPHFAKYLVDCDLVIVGGGNLIADQDLNFPVKISAAIEETIRLGKPCFIYAVGVGSHFSQKGKAMFDDAFRRADLRGVYVRDEKSRRNWNKNFSSSSGHAATVVWDPGLISSLCWPEEKLTTNLPIRVGIISPNELVYHGSKMDVLNLTAWYGTFISQLAESGQPVRLFSNGSPEDTRYLVEEIASIFPAIPYDLPENQEKLARLVARSSLVSAFRLHALIPAVSYKCPILALAWDEKVRSFAEKIGSPTVCIDVKNTDPKEAADLVVAEMKTQRNYTQHIEDAGLEIDAFAKQIKMEIFR